MSITLGTILGNRIVSFALAPICRHNRIFKGQYNLLYGTLSLMAKSALNWKERGGGGGGGGGCSLMVCPLQVC